MERMVAEDGEEDEEEDEEEEGLPFLLKDWRDSCRLMASTTVLGTLTAMNRDILFVYFIISLLLSHGNFR